MLVRNPEGKRLVERSKPRWKDNTNKMTALWYIAPFSLALVLTTRPRRFPRCNSTRGYITGAGKCYIKPASGNNAVKKKPLIIAKSSILRSEV